MENKMQAGDKILINGFEGFWTVVGQGTLKPNPPDILFTLCEQNGLQVILDPNNIPVFANC